MPLKKSTAERPTCPSWSLLSDPARSLHVAPTRQQTTEKLTTTVAPVWVSSPSKCGPTMPSVVPHVCRLCERAPHWYSSKHRPGLIPVTRHQPPGKQVGTTIITAYFQLKKKKIWCLERFGSLVQGHILNNFFESRQSDPSPRPSPLFSTLSASLRILTSASETLKAWSFIRWCHHFSTSFLVCNVYSLVHSPVAL